MSKVSIVNCSDYNVSNVKTAIEKSLNDIGFNKVPKTILIKPNVMTGIDPDKHVTTHPSVIAACCEIFKNSEIIIADSPGSIEQSAFKICKIEEVAKKYNAKLSNFSGVKYIVKQLNNPQIRELNLPQILFEVDLIINLPKLKTHGLTKYTGAIKNLYGCIPGGQKKILHGKLKETKKFQQFLVDLYEVIKPQLNIMDAIFGLEGDGPGANGIPKKTNLIISSEDAASLDMVASEIIGYKKDEIIHLDILSKKYPYPEIVGDKPRINYKKPSHFQSISDKISSLVNFNVKINKNICKKCGICQRNCPMKAIDEDYNIDNKKCIRCYCCQEFCPNNAIIIEVNLLGKLLKLIGKLISNKSEK